jgi:hypothetical protein
LREIFFSSQYLQHASKHKKNTIVKWLCHGRKEREKIIMKIVLSFVCTALDNKNIKANCIALCEIVNSMEAESSKGM